MSPRLGPFGSLTAATRIDRGGLRPVPAALAASGVVVPLVIGAITRSPVFGIAAAFGAINSGLFVMVGGLRTLTADMLTTGLAMSLATFAGSITARWPVAHLLVLAAVGFIAGLLVAAGAAASQIGAGAAIAVLILGRLSASPVTAARHAAWVLAGSAIVTAIALVARLPRRLRPQRTALATAYRALEQDISASRPAIGVTEAAEAASETVGPWYRITSRPETLPLRGLLDELPRIRHEIEALRLVRTTPATNPSVPAGPDASPVLDRALSLARMALSEVAAALERARNAAGLDTITQEMTGLPSQFDASPREQFCANRIAALSGELRAVGQMVSQLTDAPRAGFRAALAYAAASAGAISGQVLLVFRKLTAQLSASSPAFRHAIRLAVVLPMSVAIARLLPWPHSYWVALTVIIVLKPDFAGTISKGAARTAGTAVGVALSMLLLAIVPSQSAAVIALIAVCAWLGFTVFLANYAIFAIFLTMMVLFLLAPASVDPRSVATGRGIDTLLGGAIAFLAYLLWPTWQAGPLQAASVTRFAALRQYLAAVLEGYADPAAHSTAERARRAATARRAQSTVSASLERAAGDPARTRPDLDRYGGVLAAGRRIVAATHALASQLRDGARLAPVPGASVVARQADQAMEAVVAAIATGARPGPFPNLRRTQRELAADAAHGKTPVQRRTAILAALLDPLVDAIDTAADLLARPTAGSATPAQIATAQAHGRATSAEGCAAGTDENPAG